MVFCFQKAKDIHSQEKLQAGTEVPETKQTKQVKFKGLSSLQSLPEPALCKEMNTVAALVGKPN